MKQLRDLLDALGEAIQAHADRISAWAQDEYLRGYKDGYEDGTHDEFVPVRRDVPFPPLRIEDA